jgi:hypothetical protein
VEGIERGALRLMRDLVELQRVAMLHPYGVDDAVVPYAREAASRADRSLGGAATAEQPGSGITGLALRLRALGSSVRRGSLPAGVRPPDDAALAGLVYELALFWCSVVGRKPSASNPVRADGKPGPFVRLVAHCSELGGGAPASSSSVSKALDKVQLP